MLTSLATPVLWCRILVGRSVGGRRVAVLCVVALSVGHPGLLLPARLVMAVLWCRILVDRGLGRRRVAVLGVVALSVG